jgi:histidine triad (HIT) family protein
MNDACIFCKIIDGKVPAKLVHRDAEVVAIEDVNPQAPTHLLVIPVAHVATLLDLSAEQMPLLRRIFEVTGALARERNLERGFRVVVNNGPKAGQTVYHLHFHLLGGRPMQWPPG